MSWIRMALPVPRGVSTNATAGEMPAKSSVALRAHPAVAGCMARSVEGAAGIGSAWSSGEVAVCAACATVSCSGLVGWQAVSSRTVNRLQKMGPEFKFHTG